MNWARSLRLTGEVVRALLVLALLSLNFTTAAAAHDAGNGAASVRAVGTAFASFCGDLGNPAGSSDHAPCHACRLFDGVDVPPLLAIPARLAMRVTRVDYVPTPVLAPLPLVFAAARPRGPPLA